MLCSVPLIVGTVICVFLVCCTQNVFSCFDVLCSGDCMYFMCSLYVVHKTYLAVLMCSVVGIVCTLCVPCMLYTKHV